MKKALLFIALATFGFANAQKGTVLVQGDLGFTTTKSTNSEGESKNNVFSFAPKVGYQFTDNWTAGVAVYVGSGKQTVDNTPVLANDNEQKYNNLQAGAFVRYTKTLSDTFRVYADLDAGYVHSKNSNTVTQFDGFDNITTSSSYKTNGFYAAVTPAVYINVWKNFGLNFNIGGLGFGSTKDDTDLKTKNSAFSLTFGQSFSVGVSKNF